MRSCTAPPSPPTLPDEHLEHLLDALEPLEPHARAMFGGHGIYAGDVFFAILYEGRLYFRVDGDEARGVYERAGMEPFAPPGGRVTRSYYEVPAEVVADPDELVAWARRSVRGRGG